MRSNWRARGGVFTHSFQGSDRAILCSIWRSAALRGQTAGWLCCAVVRLCCCSCQLRCSSSRQPTAGLVPCTDSFARCTTKAINQPERWSAGWFQWHRLLFCDACVRRRAPAAPRCCHGSLQLLLWVQQALCCRLLAWLLLQAIVRLRQPMPGQTCMRHWCLARQAQRPAQMQHRPAPSSASSSCRAGMPGAACSRSCAAHRDTGPATGACMRAGCLPESCTQAGPTTCRPCWRPQRTLSVWSPPATTWLTPASVARVQRAPSCAQALSALWLEVPGGFGGRLNAAPGALGAAHAARDSSAWRLAQQAADRCRRHASAWASGQPCRPAQDIGGRLGPAGCLTAQRSGALGAAFRLPQNMQQASLQGWGPDTGCACRLSPVQAAS